MIPRILIAGIGNMFLGDDAFGLEVVRRLSARKLPEGVRVVDFGIRGFDLTYALLDDCDVAILVDTVSRGDLPGTLYTLELDAEDSEVRIETHDMHPGNVLRLVKALGGHVRRVLLVGCEPSSFGPEEEGQVGLSSPVQAAVEEAANMIEGLVTDIVAQAL